jgi:predicted pyridoxine 5'-phosphate oxidase superfamily flavin-nucleotide-binding protein
MADERQRRIVRRAIRRSSFCTLATASAANRPHVVGVLYAAVDGLLYVSTETTSIKARNVRENPRVAVCIPVRRYPVGPPFCVQFQGSAELRPTGDPQIVGLLDAGRLKPITTHGELDHPDACFIRVTPARRVASYGLGVPLRQLLRDPLGASRSVEM